VEEDVDIVAQSRSKNYQLLMDMIGNLFFNFY